MSKLTRKHQNQNTKTMARRNLSLPASVSPTPSLRALETLSMPSSDKFSGASKGSAASAAGTGLGAPVLELRAWSVEIGFRV